MTATPLAALAVATSALVFAPAALASAAFKTPGAAAYCGVTEGEGSNALICWTPIDGFTIGMPRFGWPSFSYDRMNRGYHELARVLRFGQSWTIRGYWRCRSRRTGLTCTNRNGNGWWLGRYYGYRIF